MLFTIDGKEIDWIPHWREYEVWRSWMDQEEFDAIFEELNRRVSGEKVQTSSWIPGRDWTDTIYQPIYDACQDQETAAKFFGLILWEVMMKHDGEAWCFGRYEKDGIPIEGLTYFRVPRYDRRC